MSLLDNINIPNSIKAKPKTKDNSKFNKSKSKQLPLNNTVKVSGNPRKDNLIGLSDILRAYETMAFTDKKNLINTLLINLKGD